MSNRKFRAAAFILFTFTVIMSVLFMDSMPDHRFGDGDYDMWLHFTVFPIIFLLHGVLSGIILDRSQKRIYLITTPLMFILAFILCGVAFDGISVFESVKIGVLGGAVYAVISIIGRILCHAVTKLIHALLLRHNKNSRSTQK